MLVCFDIEAVADPCEVLYCKFQLSLDAKKMMNEMQLLSDKGCREMNRLMRKTANPSMPYIGLYLQVGVICVNYSIARRVTDLSIILF